jgi:uncharacterized protein (DUF305 family)
MQRRADTGKLGRARLQMLAPRAAAAALSVVIASSACHPAEQVATSAPIVQPGRPGEPSRTVSAAQAADLSAVRVTPADVAFMQRMIGHHAQALEMAALLRTRTSRDDMRRLAERIDLSQADEMAMMREWLEAHGEHAPDEHAHHDAGARMPGMLTADQMDDLAAARGERFDRLFLDGMIAHHEGALTMVAELFEQPGAGQESSVFEFASDVEADQRMEIARMRTMLGELLQ